MVFPARDSVGLAPPCLTMKIDETLYGATHGGMFFGQGAAAIGIGVSLTAAIMAVVTRRFTTRQSLAVKAQSASDWLFFQLPPQAMKQISGRDRH